MVEGITLGCIKQLECLANGYYGGALEQNREIYQKVFQRYIASKKENREYLVELLESITSSGRCLADVKATMKKLNLD